MIWRRNTVPTTNHKGRLRSDGVPLLPFFTLFYAFYVWQVDQGLGNIQGSGYDDAASENQIFKTIPEFGE